MIRQRNRRRDDRAIHRMIIDELIPYTGVEVPREQLTPRAISRRLDQRQTYVMARSGRRPFGFVSFEVKSRRLLIDMIALNRGNQHRGLGGRLLAAAERYGRRRKCRESALFVDESNTGAQRFYDRKGYRMTDYMPELRCFRLAKRLSAVPLPEDKA